MKTHPRWIRAVAARLCDSTTIERLIDPILTDIELEHRSAAASGRFWQARWIRLTGYAGLLEALVLHGVHVCCRAASAGEAAGRTLAFSAAAFVVLTVALVLPPLLDAVQHPPPLDLGMFALYLVPQALPLSIPVALAFGIACGWSRDATARTMLRRIVILGIAGSVIAVSTMEWLIPSANQAFRVAVIHRLGAANVQLARGINEQSLSELWALVGHTSEDRSPANAETIPAAIRGVATRDALRRQLHLRLALCLATATLCLLAVAIASVIHRRNLARVVFAGLVLLYIAACFVQPAASVWLPNAGLAAISVVLFCVGSMRQRAGWSA